MATTTFAWGPVAIPADTPTSSPAATIPTTATNLQVTADFSAMPAGVSRDLLAQCRHDSTSPWQDCGEVTGATVGGPDLNRQGGVTEWGIAISPIPFAGVATRQVRVTLTLTAAATLSGHVTVS